MGQEQFHSTPESVPERNFSREDIANARNGFEHLAQRLNVLWMKEKLTEAEQREVDLILNNAMILEEIAGGKTPEELRSNQSKIKPPK